jgi:hypothetical protein
MGCPRDSWNVNFSFKFYSAAIGLLLLQGVSLFADEPANTGKVSRRIKDAVLAGFPAYNGQPIQAPVEKTSEEVDPEVVILPLITVSDSGGARKLDRLEPLPTHPLVAGTGVTEFKMKKLTISIPRIFFIPIGLKISW